MKHFAIIKAIIAFILLISCHCCYPQYDFKWQTDGTINSAVISNNTLYVGGSFSYVGQYKGSLVGLDNVSGTWQQGWPVANNIVHTIIPDGAGGWFAGGSFTQIGGINRTGLAHLLPDKSVDQSWNARISGGVKCMLLSGGTLYIGGLFSMAGNQPAIILLPSIFQVMSRTGTLMQAMAGKC